MLDGKKFNWERFEDTIIKATRFINNTLDINKYPIKKIQDTTLKVRAIGLGIMGLSHALYLKGIPYNSEKAIKFTEEVLRYLTLRSMKESVELAKEYYKTEFEKQPNIQYTLRPYGAYECFDPDLYFKANERFFTKNCRNINVEELKEDIKKNGIRNSATTSIAPTGSISFLADVSSGIEPVFALSYARKIEKLNREYEIVYITDPIFEKYLNENFDEKTKLKILKEVSENSGSCQKCEDISEEIRKVFIVAGDLTPMEHLDILEAVCNATALSVSKTINMPNSVTKEEVGEVFLEAHKRGIIGVTVYRDGCREGILVHSNSNGNMDKIIVRHAPKRPKKLPCDIYKVTYQGKTWIVFVGLLDNKPYEIFAGTSEDVTIPKNITDGYIIKQKSRHYSFEYDGEIIINNICKTFANKENDAFARTISMGLRHGAPIQYVVETLNKSEGDITHLAKVLARTLKKYIEDGQVAGKCPDCGTPLLYREGCICCPSCGFSKCN
jgi:ribonucleoside-diphosphate reductase alpha chain